VKSTGPLPRIPTPPGTAFREFRIAVLPVLTFAAVLGLTVATWKNYVGPSQLVGEVASERALVLPNESGTVLELMVGLYQRVTNGQVVATLSPGGARVQALQLAASRARESFLRDAIGNSLREERNRFSEMQITLNWLDQYAELRALRAQRDYFQAELKRQEELAGDRTSGLNVGSLAELQIARRDYDSLVAQIEERTRLVEMLDKFLHEEVSPESSVRLDIAKALQEARDAENRELSALDEQAGTVELRSSLDGVVSEIFKHEGENVSAGDPILSLSGDRIEHVRGFVRQPLNLEVRTNMAMQIRCRSKGREAGVGQVVAVGSQLEPILPQLLPRGMNSNAVEYGLPFLVRVPAGFRAHGGEVVDLYPAGDDYD